MWQFYTKSLYKLYCNTTSILIRSQYVYYFNSDDIYSQLKFIKSGIPACLFEYFGQFFQLNGVKSSDVGPFFVRFTKAASQGCDRMQYARMVHSDLWMEHMKFINSIPQ